MLKRTKTAPNKLQFAIASSRNLLHSRFPTFWIVASYRLVSQVRNLTRMANLLTEDVALRIASDIAKLPTLVGAADHSELNFPEGGG